MIFHASIPADNPQRVAEVMAEIWGGEAFRFPPWPGAYVAIAGDDRGTTCEVYPRSQTMARGDGEQPAWPKVDELPSEFTVHHIAVMTEKSEEEILALAQREGWRALRCSRGHFFDVIEMWVENRMLVEVLTKEMQVDYRKNVNMEMWRWTKEEPPVAV